MHLTLIDKDEYAFLLEAFTNYPNLTLQNKGYETLEIKGDKITADDKTKIKEIENLLRLSVKGFSEFTNFRLTKNGEPEIRFRYDWNADVERPTHTFIGVGYLKISEFINGFDADKDPITVK